jgi:hypothetical protein
MNSKKFTQQKSAETGTNQQIPAFSSGIFVQFWRRFEAFCTPTHAAADPPFVFPMFFIGFVFPPFTHKLTTR